MGDNPENSSRFSMDGVEQTELEAVLEDSRIKPEKTEATLTEALTASTSSDVASDSADDQRLMQDLLNQMKELTDEVKILCQKLDTGQCPSAEGATDVKTEDSEAVPRQPDSSDLAKKKKSKVMSIVSNLLFYVIIVMVVFGAFLIRSSKGNGMWTFAGYSAMTVLTGSMQDVYPQGSLIVVKSVDTDKLNIGDDITFMTGETSSITHRIIGIIENYLDTGERGFETKGVMNENADKDIVAAGNVVGRVVFCSPALGKTANFVTANWQLLLFFVLVLAALVAFLQWNARRSE